MAQFGAISTMQGHHWIVESNTVRQVNGLGLDYGRRHTFVPYLVPADTPKLAGVNKPTSSCLTSLNLTNTTKQLGYG